MSASNFLSQLKGLVQKTELLKAKLHKVYPTDQQWNEICSLSEQLASEATETSRQIQTLKESRTKRAWEESARYRSDAQASQGELLAHGRLKNSAVFRRNMITIFEGPKDSKFDSEDVKQRKIATRQRCELIKSLSPDGVVSWSIAFAPSLWAVGSMSSDVFDCLLQDIEPDLAQTWPPVILNTLKMLLEDEASLQECSGYKDFLNG